MVQSNRKDIYIHTYRVCLTKNLTNQYECMYVCMYTYVPVHTVYMRYAQHETLGYNMYATATQRIQVPSVSEVLDFMRSSETKRSITLRTRCRCNNTPIYAHVNADKKHCSGIFTLVSYYFLKHEK